MASGTGSNDAGGTAQSISSELMPRSKRLLGKGLASIGYETELKGVRKDFRGVPSSIFKKEAAVLVGLDDHKNIVKTHGWTVDKMSCSLILEYMDDDLLGFLQKRKESQRSSAGRTQLAFELQEAIGIMLQIARGMENLHEQGILHGDLKTNNILVTQVNDGDKNSLSVKVADFGLVRTKRKSIPFVSRHVRKLDMVQWKAPECFEVMFSNLSEDDDETSESDSYSDEGSTSGSPGVTDRSLLFRADVYSFALTCFQILTGEEPYPNRNWKELAHEIVQDGRRPILPDSCPPLLRNLLVFCWHKDPAKRLTFSAIRTTLEYLHTPQTIEGMRYRGLDFDKFASEQGRITSPFDRQLYYTNVAEVEREALPFFQQLDLNQKLQGRTALESMLRKDKAEPIIMRGMVEELREALKEKDEELRRAREEQQSDRTLIANLRADLRGTKASNAHADSQVADLTTRMNGYKLIADRLTEQLSSLERSKYSKSWSGTGAHEDSHAIPPNLKDSVFLVNEAAFAFTKTYMTFLTEKRKGLENHVAWQSMPDGADLRYRKFAVQAYICSLLFAGFENDSYVESSDYLQSSQYLLADYEEYDFFVHNQDLKLRHQRYLLEYDQLRELGLQGVMEILETDKAERINAPFLRFCCRKLVNIVGVGEFRQFPHGEQDHLLLHRLAMSQKHGDKFLKSFVNLAMAAFLLHRLTFQFNPPARIFRYARGTKFDPYYMEPAVPTDDYDSDDEFIVGLMLVPGFQVGATIFKCKVVLVPRSMDFKEKPQQRWGCARYVSPGLTPKRHRSHFVGCIET